MSSPSPFGDLKGGTKELCDGLEPTVAAVTLTSNERTTSFTMAEQSTATASTSIPRSSMDKISYKLLSKRRRLVNAIKHLRDDLSGVSSLVSFNKIAPEFHNFVRSYSEFRFEVDKVTDLAHVGKLICGLAADYENLCSSFKDLESRFVGSSARDEDDVAVKASDSVSQASLGRTISSSKSSAARRIELECKRASLLAIRDLEKAKAKAKEAEAEAKFRIEEAKLAAEERLIALSEPGLSEAGSRRSASKVVERKKFSVVMSPGKHSYRTSCPQERNFEQYIQVDKETVRARPEASIPKPLYSQSGPVETKPFVNPGHPIFNEWREPRGRHINDVDATSRFAHFRPERTNSDYMAGDSRVLNDHVFQTYLDRQNRKEYINLASQMSFNGDNIAFVFFKNQIQKLMNQCSIIERRLEVLRAACVGQPREMVNLFFGPMRGLSTSERVEKALERLSERYSVPGGLTAEPAIVDIRNGSRVLHNVVSLKKFREDLNTLEVFAYAHNEIEKLSGQLLLDVANRLPGLLKRQYLDYLDHLGLDLNKPGFDSLRNFVGHELKIMTSEYAQTFFKQNEKSGEFGNSRNTVHVRQSVFQSNDAKSQTVSSKAEFSKSNGFNSNRKLPPVCFYCNDTSLKHYLGDCEI